MISPNAVKFALIQGTVSVIFLYIIARLTGAAQIVDLWILIAAYIGLNLILNLLIPGRYR